ATPWAALAAGSALSYHILLQNGRLLLRIEALERRLDARQEKRTPALRGLPPGTLVPDFDLPLLNGGRATLRSFRGRRVLLIFFDPACGFCREMLPDLAAVGAAATEVERADGRDGTVRAPRLRTRPLSTSRLLRDGLPAGTPAPAFRLPRLDGGAVSLADFSGRRLLLVFSDPECGPCSALAPEL